LPRNGNYQASSYYNFNTIFDIDASDTSNITATSTVNFNEFIQNDFIFKSKESVQFLDSLVSSKREYFELFVEAITNFYYQNKLKITIFPIHKLISKYKNKGLDSSLNVNDFYSNTSEANSVNKLFYDMFYDSLSEISYRTILKAKESFFVENKNLNYFYDAIDNNLVRREMSSRSNNFYSSEKIIDIPTFRTIINELYPQRITDADPEYAYEFIARMFQKELAKKTFPREEYSIISNINMVNQREPNDIVLAFSDIVKFDLNFIKSLGLDLNQRGIISGATYDIRLCLVPYFSFDQDSASSASSFDETNTLFESVSYDGKDCITLKPTLYRKEIIGYDKILYEGLIENQISIDESDDFSLLMNTNTRNIDLFKAEVYRFLWGNGILENARMLGYTRLYELALNVCILVTTESDKSGAQYFSDYYQIKLLNNLDNNNSEDSNNIIHIDNIRSIRFINT
jgi:hypothetical protein